MKHWFCFDYGGPPFSPIANVPLNSCCLWYVNYWSHTNEETNFPAGYQFSAQIESVQRKNLSLFVHLVCHKDKVLITQKSHRNLLFPNWLLNSEIFIGSFISVVVQTFMKTFVCLNIINFTLIRFCVNLEYIIVKIMLTS